MSNEVKIAEWLLNRNILVIRGKRGSGKTNLARKIFQDLGIEPQMVASANGYEKWIASEGIVIDNAGKKELKSPYIPAMTLGEFTARKAGSAEFKKYTPPRIIVTTNEMTIPGDIERRAVIIDL